MHKISFVQHFILTYLNLEDVYEYVQKTFFGRNIYVCSNFLVCSRLTTCVRAHTHTA